jgi:3-hydroxyacyl-CoA dehydrogenase
MLGALGGGEKMSDQVKKDLEFARIKKVAVIGSGVMGSGIAAQLANARVPCLLLDMMPKALSDQDKKAGFSEDSPQFRNKLSLLGLKNALSAKPAAFFSKKNAGLIEVGNLEDDLDKVKACDWVIEVVVENLEIKQKLFERLQGVVYPNAIISSNTSGLSIDGMLQGCSEDFKKRFLVTHFFNPPRYLHLLELVAGPQTSPEVMAKMAWFGENILGKGIVYGKDTPNFVANRIGVFAMMEIMRLMQEEKYTVEEVDAIFGPAIGRPKSAVFRTADVVGLDTFVHVAQNCFDNLKMDERKDTFAIPQFLQKMVDSGWLGQKSGQGFYKKSGTDIHVLDIETMNYQPKQKIRFESLGAIRRMENTGKKIKFLCNADDRAGQLTFKAMAAVCVYSAYRLFEIADDIVQIDNAMKWGFGWELGPFESWDALGVRDSASRMEKQGMKIPEWVNAMLAQGRESFYQSEKSGQQTFWDPKSQRPKNVKVGEKAVSLTVLKRHSTNIVKDSIAATLIDLGDGVLACEFHTKMNAIDGEITQSINDALDLCESGQFDSLVLANEGTNFSVGANILLLYMAAQQGEFVQIEHMVKTFQDTCRRLYYSSVPTVAAPFQMTLGGGAEVSLWCNKICAHAELYMGLVEVGIGLIPGGGGNIALLARTLQGAIDDPNFMIEHLIKRAFETVAMAKVSTSAEDARDLLFLMRDDILCMNRRQLLFSAKHAALGMAKSGFMPPLPRFFRLPGSSAAATFDMVLQSMKEGHFISEHDYKVARKVVHVMTGGDCTPRVLVSEQHLLDLEREAFLSLCGEEKSMARIAYMLEHNKPLRN